MERNVVVTTRDCPARLVSVGTPITINKDTFVTITQSLGGNYTVTVNGNMARVDGTDADALGMEATALQFDAPGDDKISEDQVWTALKTIYDPEIPVDIVNLGLIYAVDIDQTGKSVTITMTLTAPGCGMGEILVQDAQDKIAVIPTISDVVVELVFDPPWNQSMMSDEARLQTGLM